MAESPPAEAADLIATLVMANADSLAYTTNALIEGLTYDRDYYAVALTLVQDRITDLLEGKYQPTNHAILAALYPDRAVVEKLVKGKNNG